MIDQQSVYFDPVGKPLSRGSPFLRKFFTDGLLQIVRLIGSLNHFLQEEEQKKKYEERQLALERELLDAAKGSALLLTRLVSLVVLGRWYFDQHESLLLEILGGHRTSTFVDAIRAGSVDWSAYIEPLLEKGLGAKSVFDLFDVAQKALIAGSNILEERVRRFGKL